MWLKLAILIWKLPNIHFKWLIAISIIFKFHYTISSAVKMHQSLSFYRNWGLACNPCPPSRWPPWQRSCRRPLSKGSKILTLVIVGSEDLVGKKVKKIQTSEKSRNIFIFMFTLVQNSIKVEQIDNNMENIYWTKAEN